MKKENTPLPASSLQETKQSTFQKTNSVYLNAVLSGEYSGFIRRSMLAMANSDKEAALRYIRESRAFYAK